MKTASASGPPRLLVRVLALAERDGVVRLPPLHCEEVTVSDLASHELETGWWILRGKRSRDYD